MARKLLILTFGAVALLAVVLAATAGDENLTTGGPPQMKLTKEAPAIAVVNTNDAGPGSLRDAINLANGSPGGDIISFNIPGPGLHTIQPLSPLPALIDPSGVLIDGLTQPGATTGANPPSTAVLMIELNGSLAGLAHGLYVQSSTNTIRGLIINRFQQDGIRIEGIPGEDAYNNWVNACFIGTDQGGSFDLGNGTFMQSLWAGVEICNQPGGSAHHNWVTESLISGNWAEGVAIIGPRLPGDVHNNHVFINYIGTDKSGTADLGNDHDGVCMTEGTHDNFVTRNLISGNNYDGVGIQGFNNVGYGPPIITYANRVDSNIIGIDVNVTGAIPNTFHGIAVGEYGPTQWGCASKNILGPNNHVAYNGGDGVAVWEDGVDVVNADRNQITQNSIYDNAGLGIDLRNNGVTPNDPGDVDTGPNEELNFPVILTVTYAAGTTNIAGAVNIDTPPNLATVEIFKAKVDPTGYGEGQNYLVSVIPDALGNWTAAYVGLAPGDFITATVTDLNGNTSEFAANAVVPGQTLDTCTYYKAPYIDYAPAGMPDFDQKQNGWFTGMPPGFQWTHCGPVALANCLWWFDSKFEKCLTPPPAICDSFRLVKAYGQWDDHDSRNVIPFVDSLAKYCKTNLAGPGTNVADLASGAQAWIDSMGLTAYYTVRLLPLIPPFTLDTIKQEVLRSQDVILLLGFWQEVTPTYCERIGGHYVTVAGTCVDPLDSGLCISDPFYDRNEGEPPAGSAHGSAVHNDAQFVSGPHGTIHHDKYNVTTARCIPPGQPPFGLEFANYPINPGEVTSFLGLNNYDPTMPPVPPIGSPIHTVLEFALIICPTLDTDGDGIPDTIDNCPYIPNPDQSDVDQDGVGDVCDNCPNTYNPDQSDKDVDGFGDVCDNCPITPNPNQSDLDRDGAGDVCDNCPNTYNPGQEDADLDGVGNACDPDYPTYMKPGYPDYAPFGMPDIDQKQMPWNNGIQWTHCGPVAVANCLFWYDSKFEYLIDPISPPPPAVDDHFRLIASQGPFDDHDPRNVAPTVNMLAACMATGPLGTDVNMMNSCVTNYIAQLGLEDTLRVRLVARPNWMELVDRVKASHDVILLLGFWQADPQSPQRWSRIGGHYVTMAGVDTTFMIMPNLYLSDPYFDMLEGDPPAPLHPSQVHNDLALVSGPHGTNYHDGYMVSPGSTSPGGIIELPGYPIMANPAYPNQFYLLNCPPEFAPFQAAWNGSPIHTEIEYALVIEPFVCDCKPGDANGNGSINVLDVTYLISFLYKGGPAPTPYAICSGDANCNCTVNILDATYLITFLYKSGLPPCDCNTWVGICGMPLRK